MGTRSPGDRAARPGPLRRTLAAAGVAVALLLAPLTLLRAADLGTAEPLANLPTAALTIESHGRRHPFQVWLATTPARHEQGLMYVKHLEPRRGMLFLWGEPEVQTFWMKNTLIPLDLLFIAADGRIIRIAPNATPMSEALISSMGPVLGVLELAGGTCGRLGIATGDRVRHAAFDPR